MEEFGQLNIVWAWCWMVFGIGTGSIIGIWSFNGPFPTPKGWENYDSLPRRQVRLGHVACTALPFMNLFYGQYIDATLLSPLLLCTL